MNWIQNFINALVRSPMGPAVLATVANAAVEGNIRPWLRNHGSDIAVSAAPGAVQVDYANRSLGQTTILWRAPAPVLAQPTQLVPLDQLWNNIQAAQQLNNAANAAQQP